MRHHQNQSLMTEVEFDAWDTVTSNLQTQIQVGSKSFSKSLHDRAIKRIPDVSRIGVRAFVVVGREAFRDTYPEYAVTWKENDDYECSCWALQHGESRSRRSCSHVLAVMLYREGARSGGGNKERVSPPKQHQLSMNGAEEALKSGDVEQPKKRVVDGEGSMAGTLTTTVPSTSDPMWQKWDTQPLPAKFQEIRETQWDAIQEALECYARGVEVVFLDGPTGTGKSLIAELIRRLLQTRAFYICHSKTLQHQFLTDFSYARLLMGRSNYPTLDGPSDVNCADCTSTDPDTGCMWCDEKFACPYQVAKSQAIQSKLAILNTAYFLTEFNYVGQVGVQRELGIIDECDILESELMGFVEFFLGERMLNRIGLAAPKEGSHYTTLGKWLIDDFKPKLYEYAKTIRGDDVRAIREKMSVARLIGDVLRIGAQIDQDETLANWVRDNKAGPFVLKPVTVNDYGDRNVWVHAKKWLCMSATIISADELSDSCGLQGGNGEGEQGRRFELVTVPMTFPVENRPIIVAPIADMSRKGKEAGEWNYAVRALYNICMRHAGERILVHTNSYELARFLVSGLSATTPALTRPVYSYNESSGRDAVLARFRRTEGAVLVAPSMDRGVDLAGDDCRVIVVAKIPFPYLGDPQINKRLKMKNGESWYAVQTVRKLVQMTGRAVRNEDDYATCYIIDKQMQSNVLKKSRRLLPKWWQEALVMDFPVRELLK